MLNNILIISQGRLIERKGALNEDISKDSSLFNELKESIFRIYFNNILEVFSMDKKEVDNKANVDMNKYKWDKCNIWKPKNYCIFQLTNTIGGHFIVCN